KAVSYAAAEPAPAHSPDASITSAKRALQGVDVYVQWESRDSDALAAKLQTLAGPEFKLTMLTSRGVKVWPDGMPATYRGDQFRCRHMAVNGGEAKQTEIVALLGRITSAGLSVAQTVSLFAYDGERGYSLGQGE